MADPDSPDFLAGYEAGYKDGYEHGVDDGWLYAKREVNYGGDKYE